jgi:hypothetical protein
MSQSECRDDRKQRVVMLHPPEESRSSVKEELDSMNWELQQIMISIGNIEAYNKICNSYEIDSIRNRVNTIRQRSYRAEQCSRGLKVWKAT